MADTLARQLQRSGTTEAWASVNPVLGVGEFGVDVTLNRAKLGDGVTSWSALGWSMMNPAEVSAVLSAAESIKAGVDATDGVMATVAADESSAFHAELSASIDGAVAVSPSSSQTFGRLQSSLTSTVGTRIVVGVDATTPNGAIWCKDTTNGVLVQSDDGLATQGINKTLPTGVTASGVSRIVRAANGYVYLLGLDTTDSRIKVWRAPHTAQGAVFAWSAALLTLEAGTTGFDGSLDASSWGANERIVVAEYGDPAGGPSVYVSSNGTSFARTYGPDSSIRHMHHIAVDPFVQGQMWMTCGDGIAKTIQRSTDFGLTWSVVVASSQWQGVQLSFTATHVWVAGDSRRGTALAIDRDTLTPRWAASNYHHDIMPPVVVVPARKITATATSGSATLASSGLFSVADQRRYVEGIRFAPDTYISAVNPPNEVTLSKPAIASGAADTVISGDLYFANAYWGAVDPETGTYYCVSNDTSNVGQKQGLFWLPRLGGRIEILDPGGESNLNMNGFVHIYRGKLLTGRWQRPLVSVQ